MTEYNAVVVISAVDKIALIKGIRAAFGVSLVRAKNIAEEYARPDSPVGNWKEYIDCTFTLTADQMLKVLIAEKQGQAADVYEIDVRDIRKLETMQNLLDLRTE